MVVWYTPMQPLLTIHFIGISIMWLSTSLLRHNAAVRLYWFKKSVLHNHTIIMWLNKNKYLHYYYYASVKSLLFIFAQSHKLQLQFQLQQQKHDAWKWKWWFPEQASQRMSQWDIYRPFKSDILIMSCSVPHYYTNHLELKMSLGLTVQIYQGHAHFKPNYGLSKHIT